MSERYVLLLCSLNPDRTDLSGNQYPESGYVSSKNFKPDQNIQNGLYGTLWGNTETQRWLNVDPEAEWVVIKTERNDDLIPLSGDENFFKFRSGMVVFFGDRESCTQYVATNAPAELREGVIGAKVASKVEDAHVLTKGFASCAFTESAGTHAVNVGNKGSAKSKGWGANAIVLGGDSLAVAEGENAMAVSYLGNSRAEANGDDAKAIAIGTASIVITGKRGIAAGLAPSCEGKADEEGALLLVYRDVGDRLRVRTGYVGEDIKANVFYRLSETGEFVEVGS